MDDDYERWDWHEHPGVTWAAGAAVVALVALLVVAVVRTSDSSHAPGFVPSEPAGDATTSAYTTSSSSTSYTVPSVQTSQDSGVPVVTDGPLPTDEGTVGDTPTSSSSATSTTNSNPYGTTTPTNAGHV